MSRKKNPVFNEKHLKALALIEKGQMTLKDVASAVGWKEDYLYDLYEGDTGKAGEVASLFSAEVKAIDKKQTQRIKELTKSNKALAHKLINKILTKIDNCEYQTEEEQKLVATLLNAISKSTPSVEIGNVSYSYTKGLTAEQLVYEFKRLQTLAGLSSNRRAISEAEEGGPGMLPEPSESGD